MMAPQSRGVVIMYPLLIVMALIVHTDGECNVPEHFIGEWFSVESDKPRETAITTQGLSNEDFTGTCHTLLPYNGTGDAQGYFDAQVLLLSEASNCYRCYQLYHQTVNVIQYRLATLCDIDISSGWTPLGYVCAAIQPNTELFTLFRQNLETVNCKNTFEGVYHFTYEIDEGGGSKCDSSRNYIIACQEPGSPYVDNQVMYMYYGTCPGISSSVNQNLRYQCMGEWRDDTGNIWAALADTGEDEAPKRFKCMLTRDDQQEDNNIRWYSMSKQARCDTLNSPYEGDIRYEVMPALNTMESFYVTGSQLVEQQCNLPRNFSGTWFTAGEFDTDVTINSSHIYFKTKIDQFTYRETYFTCQQNTGSRFLMTAVTVGKCEVDYVCFDFAPRHHNIIRWRMSKPYRVTYADTLQPNWLQIMFGQACDFNSFTIDRTQADWTYQLFILDPPSPVDCPIAGRYQFTQTGLDSEKFKTRVEGITVRPRHQIDCREQTSEFKSCQDNTKKLFVDVEYCSTVDHTGRPIGEYDIADNELACVGYWMEDMKSYMITYDEEDAVSRFRCWVYERLDWRDFVMSKATRALCSKLQTAYSYLPSEGATLHLVLKESERIYDDCPQRFIDGSDPYDTELKVLILGGASGAAYSLLLLVLSICVHLLHHH